MGKVFHAHFVCGFYVLGQLVYHVFSALVLRLLESLFEIPCEILNFSLPAALWNNERFSFFDEVFGVAGIERFQRGIKLAYHVIEVLALELFHFCSELLLALMNDRHQLCVKHVSEAVQEHLIKLISHFVVDFLVIVRSSLSVGVHSSLDDFLYNLDEFSVRHCPLSALLLELLDLLVNKRKCVVLEFVASEISNKLSLIR